MQFANRRPTGEFMAELPDWVQKSRGDLYHSQYEVECEDHLLAIKLIDALQIAWDALDEYTHQRDPEIAESSMKRIKDFAKTG